MKNKAWIYFSTTATNFICLIFGTVSGILTARLLGPEGRGELAIISYFPTLIGTIVPLGVPQALTFFISRDRDQEAEFASAGLQLSVILGILGSVIFALVSPRTLAENNRHLAWAVTVACLFSPAMVVNPNLYAIYRGIEQYNWVNGMFILAAGGYPLLLFALYWGNKVSPLGFALASLSLQIGIAMLNAWRLGITAISYPIKWIAYRTCIIQGARFFMPMLSTLMYIMSDRAILIRTTALTDIGFYAIAFALTYPLSLAANAFVEIGFVEVAKANDEKMSLDISIRRFQMAQVVVGISVLVLLPFINPIIRFAFGSEFIPAMVATYIMVGVMCLRGLGRSLENSLRARNHIWPGTISSTVALVCLLALGAWWVPEGGLKSFTLALLISETLGLLILICFVHWYLCVPFKSLWGLRTSIFISLSQGLFKALKSRND